jgi:hypothetical protein
MSESVANLLQSLGVRERWRPPPVKKTLQAVFVLDVTLGDGDLTDRSHHTIENFGARR